MVDNYRMRFRSVLDYIETHLDDELSVESLSNVAAFSKYHFHRQFAALFGVGVYKYIQLRRLKRASYQLAFRRHTSITDIAMACGYEEPESFSRAFKNCIGQSPSGFRSSPQWDSWASIYLPLSKLRKENMKPVVAFEQVRIVNFDETKVAVLEHRGDPRQIGNSIRNFIAWRKENRLPPQISPTFNIVYDDPDEVAPDDYRFDLCAATDREIADNTFGVIGKTIPGGRCAVLRHSGSDDLLGETVRYLYLEWLPQSGEKARDFPVYFQRVKFFPDVPEEETITDVFLPLK